MDVTRTAYGTWNGGRYMNFGVPLDEEAYLQAIQLAYAQGIRTFVTADVYGLGVADQMLGTALAGYPRATYCLVAMVGHDFYQGQRDGTKGYPRFTDVRLRRPTEYAGYLRMATERSLARCRVNSFDVVLLHNPDHVGFTSDEVWKGMGRLVDAKLTERVGVAPGPANGYLLDTMLNFERFAGLVQCAMIILSPLESWPGYLCLPAAAKYGVKLLARGVDHGGLFHDDIRPRHTFGPLDHRRVRAAGWVEGGLEKIEGMRPFAASHRLSMLQLACLWALSQPAVTSVVPTLMQELSGVKPLERKIVELASLPELALSAEVVAEIRELGQNQGYLSLKGGSPEHEGEPLPDRWGLTPELEQVARRWQIDPQRDMASLAARVQ